MEMAQRIFAFSLGQRVAHAAVVFVEYVAKKRGA